MNSLEIVSPKAVGEPYARYEYTASGSGGPSRGRQDDSEPLIELGLVRDLARFVLNAIRRRRLAASLILTAFIAAGVLAVFLLPRQYYSETKLLADRNVVMPLLGNPSRSLPTEADTPTRLAYELIMTRENLLGLAAATNLLEESKKSRPLLSRIRRSVRDFVKGPLTPAEELEEVIWALRTRMNIQVAEGTIIIGNVWNSPELAYKITEEAQRRFLAERQAQELALITGSISILEQRAADVAKDITFMLDSLSKQRAALTPEESRAILAPIRRAQPNPELLATQASLEATTRAIADLEVFRNRRLAELQSSLADLRNSFGVAHPQVQNTEEQIRAMATESPQLVQLRAEERRLRDQVIRLGGGVVALGDGNADQTLASMALRNMEGSRIDSIVQEKQAYGRSRLRIALSSYQGLLERLDAARIELQTVRATFSFKYGVLISAAIPKDPINVKPLVLVAGSIMVGLLMAVFTVVALDLAGGRILESWQIERTVGLPVLGEARLALPSK
ncbi:MAG: hypothetical protein U5K74_01535 [Gemmatimonadaceae bacterium]|nr:hypothetical protein [Gemmatimonadaceae bacterium]